MGKAKHRHRLTDVANAAALLVDAAENAGRDRRRVQTPYGPATVVLDGSGADVVLHRRGVTVHVRAE
jgi:hypothetical protein